MNDKAREWHELIDAVPELRPRIALMTLHEMQMFADSRWGTGLVNMEEVALVLCRDRALEWLGERGYGLVIDDERQWFINSFIDVEYGPLGIDRDIALRRAVEAVIWEGDHG